jgi:malonyl-CoA/methylmalonyl-CoA synthetase
MFCKRNIFSIVSRKIGAQLQHSGAYTAFSSLRMASTLPKLPVFEAIASHDPHSTVVIHSASGRRFTYGALIDNVAEAKERLYKEAGTNSLDGQRIAFLVENGYDYVGAQGWAGPSFKIATDFSIVTLLSILGTHSIAVPLSPAFPVHELKYIMDHSEASLLLASSKFDAKAQDVLKAGLETEPRLVRIPKKMGDSSFTGVSLVGPDNGRGGMMLYTSGTTSRPVNTTHPSFERLANS